MEFYTTIVASQLSRVFDCERDLMLQMQLTIEIICNENTNSKEIVKMVLNVC